MRQPSFFVLTILAAVTAATAAATETENLGIRILPVPGTMTVDGEADDWDLSSVATSKTSVTRWPSGSTRCTTPTTSTCSPAGSTKRP